MAKVVILVQDKNSGIQQLKNVKAALKDLALSKTKINAIAH
jgi:hypothetical protein